MPIQAPVFRGLGSRRFSTADVGPIVPDVGSFPERHPMDRIRYITLASTFALSVAALSGCSATPTVDSSAVVYKGTAPAVNPEVAALLEKSLLTAPRSGIRLGAGDQFGRQLHTQYLATLMTRESERGLVAGASDDSSTR